MNFKFILNNIFIVDDLLKKKTFYISTDHFGAEHFSPKIVPIKDGVSGEAGSSRYWDCCKPSCAWKDNIDKSIDKPVTSCQIDGDNPIDSNIESGCSDMYGDSYICTNQQPWVVNKTLAYGFASASVKAGTENLCCSCFMLKFKKDLPGKSMVVQAIQFSNTQDDRGYFSVAIPGSGVGALPIGCQRQWNAGDEGWGDRWGGVHSAANCSQLPEVLQKGCRFRFEFMNGVSNPEVSYSQVKCPAEIVAITGCNH